MNFPGYLVLLAAVVSVVFGQQSDGNNLARDTISVIQKCSKENLDAEVFPIATLVLQNDLINCTNVFANSENIITDGISSAKILIHQNPEAAKQLLQQAFYEARSSLFKYASPTVMGFGRALGLSNEGARQGLEASSANIQKGAFSGLCSLTAAEVMLNGGIEAGGEAAQVLLEAAQLAIETGFAGSFYKFQETIQEADQALRYAKSRPIKGQVESRNCEPATKYPESLNALKIINTAAEKALQRGANAEIIQRLRQDLTCSINDFLDLADHSIWYAKKIKTTNGIKPSGVKMMIANLADYCRNQIDGIAAKIYVSLGEVALKAGIQSYNTIGAALTAITAGQAQIGKGIKAYEDITNIEYRYQGHASKIGLEDGFKIGAYGKLAFMQSVTKCAKLAFSVL